jgi:excisionase family DNA binding protein
MPTSVAIRSAHRKQMVDVREVAEQLDCSTQHIWRMARDGRMPAPIRLGSLVRWNQIVIDRWIAAGCPTERTIDVGA